MVRALTGSPHTRVAGKWTVEQLVEWGLENCHTEAWGPFGRGWTLEHCSVNLVEPSYAPMIAHVKAWSPSTTRTFQSVPIYLDVQSEKDLEKYRGKLGRAIVLISPPREVKALFEPPAARKSHEELLRLANAKPPSFGGTRGNAQSGAPTPAASPSADAAEGTPASPPAADASPATAPPNQDAKPTPDNTPTAPAAVAKSASTPEDSSTANALPNSTATPTPDPRAATRLQADKWQLAYSEGAAVVLEPGRGDGGNVFVASVTMPRQSDDAGSGKSQ